MTQRADLSGASRIPTDPNDRPLTELVKELWEDSEKLLRQEFQLAVTELDNRVERAKRDATQAAIGGAVLYTGVMALTAALILLLDLVMAPWVAALLVGVALVAAGGALVMKGKRDLQQNSLVPERSVRSIKKDTRMLKEATR